MKSPRQKHRWLRISLKIMLAFLMLIILACVVIDYTVQFRMNDQELRSFFKEQGIDGRIGYYAARGRVIRYAAANSDTLPKLVFIHGSPASLSLYRHHLADTQYRNKFQVIAMDRPGYGYSEFGVPEPSIYEQSEILVPLIDSIFHTNQPVILVGSSYGSSIACKMLMDHPGIAEGLVLIAPSLAPGEEKKYWFTDIIETPALNWLVPRIFRSANTEKIAHEAELTQMLPYWSRIDVPVMYMQGENDNLIYTSNAAFARQQLVNAPLLDITFFKGRAHFVPFAERDAIRSKILEMLQIMQKN